MKFQVEGPDSQFLTHEGQAALGFSLVSELDPLSVGLGPVPAHSHV